jgi:hypothetical protein
METIKELPKEFIGTGEVKGFKFTQINVTNFGFLYEVNTGDTIYYEVFKRRVNKQFNNVSYPKSKSFGIWAWTTPKYLFALELLQSFSIIEKC